MRNSAHKHKSSLNKPVHGILALACLLFPLLAVPEEKFRLNSEDMVAIRAEEAWEDVEPDTVHFSGNFEMRIRDWVLHADSASLYGKIDNPDRLVMKGAPARIKISHVTGRQLKELNGEAQEIVYDRASDSIRLSGDARLEQGDNVMQSSSIEYDLKTDRIRAAGEGGVRINLKTDE
jgi:lipopolysaccharide transport protein LptA